MILFDGIYVTFKGIQMQTFFTGYPGKYDRWLSIATLSFPVTPSFNAG